MMNQTKTQNQAILEWMEKPGRSITSLEALSRFGCIRLASRIHDLRNAGNLIHDEWIEVNGKRVKRYFMARKKAKQ